ncbi:MAG: metalloregulator ArsR/SmtB family transcription factor [Gammaproteobacteria bacterium]|nr:MAG: metalloregulator ArsR/SmtB family transcription factor [Gammaproteobacteria bacterium]
MSQLAKDLTDMDEAAAAAAILLKALANKDRLLILCHLAAGEKNVTELQEILGLRQPTLSQQLSRLRYEGLVDFRRDGKSIHYRLASEEAAKVIEVLYELYCAPVSTRAAPAGSDRRGDEAKRSARGRAVPA